MASCLESADQLTWKERSLPASQVRCANSRSVLVERSLRRKTKRICALRHPSESRLPCVAETSSATAPSGAGQDPFEAASLQTGVNEPSAVRRLLPSAAGSLASNSAIAGLSPLQRAPCHSAMSGPSISSVRKLRCTSARSLYAVVRPASRTASVRAFQINGAKQVSPPPETSAS